MCIRDSPGPPDLPHGSALKSLFAVVLSSVVLLRFSQLGQQNLIKAAPCQSDQADAALRAANADQIAAGEPNGPAAVHREIGRLSGLTSQTNLHGSVL